MKNRKKSFQGFLKQGILNNCQRRFHGKQDGAPKPEYHQDFDPDKSGKRSNRIAEQVLQVSISRLCRLALLPKPYGDSIPAGLLTLDGDAEAASTFAEASFPGLPRGILGEWQSVCASNRSDVLDRAVRFAIRHTVLQLRVQCTNQTYFPIIRINPSGTGMQKELLKCNDFFREGQLRGKIFPHPISFSTPGDPGY